MAAPNRGASKLASHDAVDRLVEVDHLDGVLVDSDSAELPFADGLDLQGNAALQRAWARRDRIPVRAPAPIDGATEPSDA